MRNLKFISVLILALWLSIPAMAISKERGGKDMRKKSTFSKKGNFKKDDTFNRKDTRFGPPDPGGGGEGDPVPVDPSLGLLFCRNLILLLSIQKKEKVISCHV
jgi:hypothetical protein